MNDIDQALRVFYRNYEESNRRDRRSLVWWIAFLCSVSFALGIAGGFWLRF